MRHKQYLVRTLALIMVMVMVAGCRATEADLDAAIAPQVCPTSEPLSCPTAPACPSDQSCPTASPLARQSGGPWFSIISSATAFRIVFDPGDKCTLSGSVFLGEGSHYYGIRVKDQAHEDYVVIFQTFDEGKTLADLQAYPKTSMEAPSWAHVLHEDYVTPGSTSFHTIDLSVRKVYVSCAVSMPGGAMRIADLGPIEIK